MWKCLFLWSAVSYRLYVAASKSPERFETAAPFSDVVSLCISAPKDCVPLGLGFCKDLCVYLKPDPNTSTGNCSVCSLFFICMQRHLQAFGIAPELQLDAQIWRLEECSPKSASVGRRWKCFRFVQCHKIRSGLCSSSLCEDKGMQCAACQCDPVLGRTAWVAKGASLSGATDASSRGAHHWHPLSGSFFLQWIEMDLWV